MADTQDREENAERCNVNVNTVTISELPGRPFRITVEAPLFLVMLSSGMSASAVSNILMYRTCVHELGHTTAECRPFLSPDKANNTKELEEEVQRYTIAIFTVKTILEAVVPAVLSFFLGSWSDTYGRKPLVAWPLLGICLSSMMIVAYSIVENYGPWWFLVTSIPYSLTGGFIVMLTGAYCYLTDITTSENRAYRLTLLRAVAALGSVLGSIASTPLMRLVGNVYLMLISAAIYTAAYAFTAVFVQESLVGALKGGLTSLIDLELVKGMFKECFKRRPHREREQILLLTFANVLAVAFIEIGLGNIGYFYARDKLHWAMSDYNVFDATNTSVGFVGSLLGVIVLQNLLSDLGIAIVAAVSLCAYYVILSLATLGWHMYLAAGVCLFRGLCSPLIRSALSKRLPPTDIAKVFSLMCALEGAAPLLAPPLYNALYDASLAALPGAVYVLSACLAGICVLMLCVVQYFMFRSSPRYRTLDEEL